MSSPTTPTAIDLFRAGVACHRENKLEEAIGFYQRAVKLNPDLPDAYNNLGVALRKLGKHEAALVAYRRSANLQPNNEGLWSNMGNCLREMYRFDESEQCHKRSLELDRSASSRVFNAGLVHRDRNEADKALPYFNEAIKLSPDYVEAHWDRSLAYLTLGDYLNGWKGYEWRRRLPDNPPRRFSQPEWTGTEPLKGKTLLLTAEQGFGDMLQFGRFIPEVAKRGARIILECRPELIPVMSTIAGVDEVIEKFAKTPPFDFHAPLLSLPYRLGTTLQNLPAGVPYVSPPFGKQKPVPVPKGTILKVGIVWAGKLNPRDRSCPLDKFLPLMRHRDVAFYSFQIDDRRADIAKLGAEGYIIDLGDQIKDFGDSAALMSEMDMMISIDSSPVHLAGALGIPIWMMMLYTTDWRWFTDRDDSPWYPTMRIFRQIEAEKWDEPFQEMEQAFTTLITARRKNRAARG